MAETGSGQLVRVFIPDAKSQKCIVVNPSDTVWAAKQVVLDKVHNELPGDPLNYSLYLPSSGSGKLGKYMDDGLLLSNYALQGNIPKLEMQYKRRDYSKHVALTEKAIAKANSKSNQRKLIEYVQSSSYRKVDKLLEAGLDPNFVTEDGNTPLGLACGRNRSIQCIQSLLGGGAHIDFRGKDGLTPMHRAAIGGNAMAINSMLSYGASPNYRDIKGLTPIYHTAIMGDDTGACITLLRNRAELGIKDQGGWSELHHTSKYGHVQHAELFIRYGANINEQNLVGNAPLHVAASHGQRECAMMLLKRGADKTQSNFSGQTPSQVSILCGHHQLATEIGQFQPTQVELITLPPEYNENARQFAPKLFTLKQLSETCPTRPPAELLVGTLTQEWEVYPEDMPELDLTPKIVHRKGSLNTNGRPGSASSHSSSVRLPPDSGMGDTESLSSIELGSTHSGYSGGLGTPGPSTPTFRKLSFQQQRERLYRAGPGKYVVVQDVEAQQFGDISLRKGMPVEVTYIGKGGYWEGRVGNVEGWFPRLAIKEVGEEQYDYPSKNTPPSTESTSESKQYQDKPQTTPTNSGRSVSNIREVTVNRSNRGYGFAMRGVRATKAMQFHPTPEVPALQYVGSVEENGAASEAGLSAGDFIIEVNGYNVTHSTHDEVVNIVRKSGGSLRMKIITPLVKPKSVSQQIISQVTPVSTPEVHRKEAVPEETPQGLSLLNMQNDKEVEDTLSISSDKETMIGESNFVRRTDSPTIVSLEPSGWDSSQSQGDESPSTRHKLPGLYSYHVPVVQASPSKDSPKVMSYPLNPSQEAKTNTGRQSPNPQYSAYSNLANENKKKSFLMKSMTLPVFPAKDYPKLEDYASSSSAGSDDDDDEEPDQNASAFALALRQRKHTMEKNSIAGKSRGRSNTIPEKGSPLIVRKMANQPDSTDSNGPEESLSPIQEQILRASLARSERINSNQLRMKHVDKTEQVQDSLSRNPLAKAMSLKIDSIAYDSEDSGREDEYSISPVASPVKSYLKSRPIQASTNQPKVLPPTTKPKPQKKPSSDSSRKELNTPTTASVSTREMTDHPPKETFGAEDSNEMKLDGGDIDWRSVLKPASERVFPQVSDGQLPGKSNSEKLMPPPVRAKPSPELRQKPLSHLPIGVPSQDSTDFELPPPLPALDAHPSSFVDVAPPDGFTLVGVEIGESSTDDVIPPPLPTMITTPPPTSPTLPPPLPDTSPPPQLTSGSTGIFIFPEMTETLSSSPKESVSLPSSNNPLPPTSPIQIPVVNNVDRLPSPMPSPPSHTDTLDELNLSESVVPPPEFGHSLPNEMANKQRPISPWSPESDISDTPPPLPNEPPPLDLDTSSESKSDVPDQPITPSHQISESVSPQTLSEAGPAPTVHLQPESLGSETTSSLAQSNTSQLDSPPPRPPLPNYGLPSTPQKESSPGVDGKPNANGELSKAQVSFGSSVTPESLSYPEEGSTTAKSVKAKDETLPLTPSPTDSDSRVATNIPTSQTPSGYKNKPVADWDVADVCGWLQEINLNEHASSFEENEIVGEHLIDFNKDDLKELGVKKLGHQKTFMSKLSALMKS